MTKAVIIPARYDSTRLPGKPLALIAGKTMIERVIHIACGSTLADKIIVATEDERILDYVNNLNLKKVKAVMTSKSHESGSDRIAEVVRGDESIEYVVNLQGDEPLLPPSYIDKTFEPLLSGSKMSSLITPLSDKDDYLNPNIVKVVLDINGYAIYFSRSPIPGSRTDISSKLSGIAFRHLGIYGYTRDTILQFSNLPPSKLEQIEMLEQLRALENGIKIKLEVVNEAFPAVDTPSDLKLVEGIILAR